MGKIYDDVRYVTCKRITKGRLKDSFECSIAVIDKTKKPNELGPRTKIKKLDNVETVNSSVDDTDIVTKGLFISGGLEDSFTVEEKTFPDFSRKTASGNTISGVVGRKLVITKKKKSRRMK